MINRQTWKSSTSVRYWKLFGFADDRGEYEESEESTEEAPSQHQNPPKTVNLCQLILLHLRRRSTLKNCFKISLLSTKRKHQDQKMQSTVHVVSPKQGKTIDMDQPNSTEHTQCNSIQSATKTTNASYMEKKEQTKLKRARRGSTQSKSEKVLLDDYNDWLDTDIPEGLYFQPNWDLFVAWRIKHCLENDISDASKVLSMYEYLSYAKALHPRDYIVLKKMSREEFTDSYTAFIILLGRWYNETISSEFPRPCIPFHREGSDYCEPRGDIGGVFPLRETLMKKLRRHGVSDDVDLPQPIHASVQPTIIVPDQQTLSDSNIISSKASKKRRMDDGDEAEITVLREKRLKF
ncbi:hypothetical protein BC829DRAFT_264351 [Chytridium lagenaria]|nr:hypothetical protein BC829DRAFT_264351 [Chytridium lagenaria]